MIAHISVGVRDIDRSKRFYDTVTGTARIQVPEGCENAARLRVRSRQYRAMGRPSRAPGSSRRKVGSSLLLHSGECRRRRCVSRSRAALRWARQRCTRPAPDIWPRLLRRLHHRSGRIPDGGVLRSSRNLKSAPIKMTHSPWLPSSPTTGGRRRLRSSFDLDGWSRRSDRAQHGEQNHVSGSA